MMIRRTTSEDGSEALRLTVGTWLALASLVFATIGSVVGSTVAVVAKATRLETKIDDVLEERLPKRTLTLELAVQQISEQIKQHDDALRQRRASTFSQGS